MRASCFAISVLCVICFQPAAFGVVLAYEGYDFTNPTINGQGSGFGFTGNWINVNAPFTDLSTDGVSLDSAAFPFTPVGNRIDDSNGADARRVLTNTISLADEGRTFYTSFLLQKDDTGVGASRNVEVAMWEGTAGARLRIGSTSSNVGPTMNESQFFFGGVGGTMASGLTVTYGQPYFIVVKGVASAADTDQFFAAYYDPTETVPAAEPETWDFTYSFTSSAVISQLRTTMGASAHGQIDEIRIGDTWADVTAPAAIGPGDHNGDGKVDAADYVHWRKNDSGNDQGYADWRANFGNPPGGGGASVGGQSTVPEPATALLALTALAGFVSRRQPTRG
jgi:hypothetical protein